MSSFMKQKLLSLTYITVKTFAGKAPMKHFVFSLFRLGLLAKFLVEHISNLVRLPNIFSDSPSFRFAGTNEYILVCSSIFPVAGHKIGTFNFITKFACSLRR